MLAAEQGSSITVRAVGDDSAEAVAALVALVADGFGEEEALYAEGSATEDVEPR